jgi:hypothetical protein
MASDYQSKYAFSSDYDKSFKHSYYDKGTACREIAEQIETLSLPTDSTEIDSFVQAIKKAVDQCPQHPDMKAPIASLVEKMDDIVPHKKSLGQGG